MSFSVRPHINFLSAPGRNTWKTLPQWNKIPDTCCGHPYVPNYCTPYALALSLPEVGVQCELIKSKCLQVSTSTFSKPSFAPIFWCRYFTSDFFPSKPFLAHPSNSDFLYSEWIYILNFTLVRTGVQRLTFFSSYEPQNSSLSINSCLYNSYPWFWHPLVTPQSWSSFKTLNKAQKSTCIQINRVFSGLLCESNRYPTFGQINGMNFFFF